MNEVLQARPMSGAVNAIASKSDVHRLLFCAALADNETDLYLNGPTELSEDILATASCMEQMGTTVTYEDGHFHIVPNAGAIESPAFQCRESGSTLRFLLPVAAARTKNPSFDGKGRLPDRPISDLLDALSANGIAVSAPKLPFSFSGELQAGTYTLPGNVSSQYITGLLLALPLLKGDSSIRLTSELQSASYIDITTHALSRFGIRVIRTEDGWDIPGSQQYHSPGKLLADGDWSNSAFFLAAGALGSGVTVNALDPNSPQGDKKIIPILEQFGASVETRVAPDTGLTDYTVVKAALKGTVVDLTDIPDMLPILAVLAANAEGPTEFTGGARLRLKESDRIHSVAEMIHGLGGRAEERPDGLLVQGKDTAPLTGGTVDSYNDHRIVMAAAVGGAFSKGEKDTVIEGAEAVRKSYPTFFEDYNLLGGNAHVIEIR